MGHSLIAHYLPNTDPIYKITIIPRGVGSLGSTLLLPEKIIFNKKNLKY